MPVILGTVCTPTLVGLVGSAPAGGASVVLHFTDGPSVAAAVVALPARIDAKRPLVFAAVFPIAERHLADLRALSRSGAVLTTRTFSTSRAPQLCGRRRAPAPSSPVRYLPGGLQTIVRGERPGGLRYAIVGERYLFQRRIAFSLAVNTTQLPRRGQGPAGSSSSSFNPGQTRGALSLSATVVCAPGHSPSLLIFGLLRAPAVRADVRAGGHSTSVGLRSFPASLHTNGRLVYAVVRQAATLTARRASGVAVASQPFPAPPGACPGAGVISLYLVPRPHH